MRHKNYVPVNELTYGTKVEPVPFIPVSNNGVHYNPYQSKKKTFVSLGRGQDGDIEAKKLQWDWLIKILESHNWEMPDAIDASMTDTLAFAYEQHPSLAAGFYHPVLGHVSTQLRFPSNSEQGQVVFLASELLYVLAAKGPVKAPRYYPERFRTFAMDRDIPVRFKKDPFRVGFELYTAGWETPIPIDRALSLLDPPDMSKVPFTPGMRPTKAPWARQDNHADLYASPDLIQQAAFEGIEVLERALEAFRHLGLRIFLTTTSGPKREEDILDSLHIQIPGDDTQTNKLGHTINISSRGIDVTCGYVLDDERHRGYQMREARKFLEQVQEYQESSFKIERPTEGEG